MRGIRVRLAGVALIGVVFLGAGTGLAISGNLGFGLALAVIGLVVLLTGYSGQRPPAGDRSEP
jgi:hypothetical protein